ncbi:MAG: hypothetical protein BZY80_00615 [SAR202 cluster bacterium Io17-Chloro-G2]|nr:MAG: hypothetical protein BZY80_00615 [SAR202 cluster bacterium Io17-Chloro-G2]
MLKEKLPWTQDGLTDDESKALRYLTSLTSTDQALGQAVTDYQWVMDDITSDEKWALQYLSQLHGREPELGALFAESPWVADGVTEIEKRGLQYLTGIHQNDPQTGAAFINLPWLTDGIVSDERWALQYLKGFQDQDLALGNRMLQRQWVTDGITAHEKWSLLNILEVHAANSELGEALASLPWTQDDITEHEQWTLRNLNDIHEVNPTLAGQLASMPFLSESATSLDVDTLNSIDNLRVNHPEILDQLLEQDWYLDGMDDQEAALVMMVGASGSTVLGPDDLRGFLVKHHADSRSVALPLSGEVELIFVQSAPNKLNDDIVDQVEDAIRLLEEFMSIPFPVAEVVLLMATPGELSQDFDVAGLNFGTHIVVDPSLARQGDNNRVLNHEVAHYYWGTQEAPLWFYEGASDFLSSYIRDRLYDDTLADQLQFVDIRELRYCKGMGMNTVQKLIDDLNRQGYSRHSAMPYFFCNYSTGHYLLLNLFADLGSDAVRTAMAGIYQTALSEGRPASEAEIYLAFLRQTTSESSEDYKTTYLTIHGGDLPES